MNTHALIPHMKRLRAARGFTLIELMVSVSVFAIIMTLAAGGYLVIIGANRQAQAEAASTDNLAFALETITRTIRTGTHYNCGSQNGGCTSSGTSLYVTASDGVTTLGFTRTTGSACGASAVGGCLVEVQGANTYPLTSPDVDVYGLTFYVSGTSVSDNLPPHVTMTISGRVSTGAGKYVPFSIETGATMRGTDL